MKGKLFISGISRITKIISLLLISTSAFAQSAQKEINEQVWKPFITSFDEGNTDVFMSLHSKDVIRSPRDGKGVLNWDQYKEQTSDWNASRKGKFDLELRFTERLSNGNQAVETGVYKTSSTVDGKTMSGYGKFLVVLRKENGIWKILVDTDSSEGNTVNEKTFAAAHPMIND